MWDKMGFFWAEKSRKQLNLLNALEYIAIKHQRPTKHRTIANLNLDWCVSVMEEQF